MAKRSFIIYPIGYISQTQRNTRINIYESYRSALDGLVENQWIFIFVWLHLNDSKERRRILKVHPMGDTMRQIKGVFATRSPVRPNPLGLYLVKIIHIDVTHGILNITKIDVFENTPVIDIKPYVQALDSINPESLSTHLGGDSNHKQANS